jgi:RHS repeat-associated protein
VTDSRNRVTTMTYDVVNRMATKTLPNGVKTVYSYDDLDRIINLTYTKANGTVLVSETYTRNAGGEPSKVLREDGSYMLYEYDAAVRLSKEVVYNPAGGLVESIGYTYDLDGKRIKKVDAAGTHNYNYNTSGQLATVGQDGYVYDADGRLSQVTRDGKTVVLSHDAVDHLTQVSVNGVNTQYLYDAQGNRIGEVSGGYTKNYLVAPNLINGLESTDLVTDGNGNVVSDYVYGVSGIIARLDTNGDPIYYLTDSMGSVIGLVNGNGDRVSRIIYDGFGEVKSGDDGTSLGGDFRFQGQWLETESGLYYMRARDYDAKTGLFLSRDAVDVQQQSVEAFNPYQFAYNNPLVYSDPTGLFSITEINATLSAQDILTGLRTYSGQRAKDYALQKLGDSLGSVVVNILDNFLPGSSIGSGLLQSIRKGNNNVSDLLESLLQDAICGVLSGFPFGENLRLVPKINVDGQLVSPGLGCSERYDDKKLKQLNLSKLAGSRPDFLFIQGQIKSIPKNNNSYLVGDIKLTQTAAVRDILKEDNQWKAMANYASKYQTFPFVAYISFIGNLASEKKVSDADRAEVLKHAIQHNVVVILGNLIGRT